MVQGPDRLTEMLAASPLELERSGWRALSADARAARAWYDGVLDAAVLMLLPGGLVIDSRDGALDAMGGPPWSAHRLSEERVLTLDERTRIVVYRAAARRGDDDYVALCSSTYVHRPRGWKLAFHQQTPV